MTTKNKSAQGYIRKDMEETYKIKKHFWGLLKTHVFHSTDSVGDHVIVECGDFKPRTLGLVINGLKYNINLEKMHEATVEEN